MTQDIDKYLPFEVCKAAKEGGVKEYTSHIYLHEEGTFVGTKGTDTWKPAVYLTENSIFRPIVYNNRVWDEREVYPAFKIL